MMTKRKRNLIIALFIVCSIFIAVGTSFVVKIIHDINKSQAEISDNNDNKQDNTSDNDEKPAPIPDLIVASSITTSKLESFEFKYQVSNLGTYTLTFSILDTSIAIINESNVIIPLKVGETKIISEINCEPKIQKTTTLTILDAVTDFEYSFKTLDNKTADYLYTNNSYYLEIVENANVIEVPNIGWQNDFVTNFQFVSKDNNILTYKFTVTKAGNLSFDYVSKYCHKQIEICAYEYPSDFEVTFSNEVLADTIELYLFNNKYTESANNAGYYDNINFIITKTPNSNDNVVAYISDGACAEIVSDSIVAKSTGSAKITFHSTVSNIDKEYNIVVKEVKPETVIYNDTSYNIGSHIDLILEPNVSYDFKIEICPIFAIGSISLDNGNGVEISNNKIKLLTEDTQNINVSFNNTNILSFTISKKPTFDININVYFCSDDYSLADNTITIEKGENDCYLILDCSILSDNKDYSQDLLIDIKQGSVFTSNNNNKSENGYFTLIITEIGTSIIEIYNEKLNISKVITIIVK